MFDKSRAVGAATGTGGTLVRVLGGVVRQVVLPRERLATYWTRVRPVTGVQTRMTLEVRARCEGLEAGQARENAVRRFVVVDERLGICKVNATSQTRWNDSDG